MINLSKLLLESSKEEKKIKKQEKKEETALEYFKKANVSEDSPLKLSGIKKLAKQIQHNKINFKGFPKWVLQTWMDEKSYPAIPLNNNRWMDVSAIENSENELEGDNIVYAGVIVDPLRKTEFGIKAIKLTTDKDINLKKYKQLILFKQAVIQAKKILDAVEQKKPNNTSMDGMTTEQNNGTQDTSTENSITSTPPSSSTNNSSSGGGKTDDSGFIDLGNQSV